MKSARPNFHVATSRRKRPLLMSLLRYSSDRSSRGDSYSGQRREREGAFRDLENSHLFLLAYFVLGAFSASAVISSGEFREAALQRARELKKGMYGEKRGEFSGRVSVSAQAPQQATPLALRKPLTPCISASASRRLRS